MDNLIRRKINERLKPKIWNWDFIALQPILKNITRFSKIIEKENPQKILDLGCGVKPYESLFDFTGEFVGFDIVKNERVDVVGKNWNLPFQDNKFDGLISTQSLEHTVKIRKTVKEIRRVVKPGGLIFVSVPFAFPEHGAPYDFYRFTRYGLREIFHDFEVVEIIPSSGYVATLLRLVNNFLVYFPGGKHIFKPLFLINNSLAFIIDWFVKQVLYSGGVKGKNIYNNVYMGFPDNYVIILRNNK